MRTLIVAWNRRWTISVLGIPCCLLTMLAPAADVWAQASCQLPPSIQAPSPRTPDWTNKNVATDYLALVLSWSPEHCAQQTSVSQRERAAFQCQLNHFEFVVHGLWPQSRQATSSRDHPRHCKPSGPIDTDVLKRHLCAVPGTDLMQNEWQAHGTCGWQDADSYFNSIEALLATYQRPGFGQLAGSGTGNGPGSATSGHIKQAFVAANPGKLTVDQVQVSVASGNKLKEVWICLSGVANPTPVACPPGGTPDGQTVSIRRPDAPTTPPPGPPVITEPVDAGDVTCPARQKKFGGYSSAAKSALWSGVYGNGGKTIYCQAPFSAGSRQTAGGLPINIEHALPKSKIKVTAGQGDLHNLWPSIIDVNSARGNFALTGDIPGEDWLFTSSNTPELSGCDFEVASVKKQGGKVTLVEPAPLARGRLARSVLHMALAYGVPLPELEWSMYLAWHEQFLPEADEQRRNDQIAQIQNTRNPFIDSPAHARVLVQACR